MAELEAALTERDEEIARLKCELASRAGEVWGLKAQLARMPVAALTRDEIMSRVRGGGSRPTGHGAFCMCLACRSAG